MPYARPADGWLVTLDGDMAVAGGWGWRVAGEVFGACSLSLSLDGSLAGGILLIFLVRAFGM